MTQKRGQLTERIKEKSNIPQQNARHKRSNKHLSSPFACALIPYYAERMGDEHTSETLLVAGYSRNPASEYH